MTTPQLIITIITSLAFLAGIAYLATYGRRIRYPKGDRQRYLARQGRMGYDIEITAVYSGVGGQMQYVDYAKHVRYAMQAVSTVWDTTTGRRFSLAYPHIVIHFADRVYKDLHGLQTYASARIGGNRLPMLVVEDIETGNGYEADLVRLGQLIVHEATHLIVCAEAKHPDRHHTLHRYWAELSPEAFEAKALAAYNKIYVADR